MFILNRLTIAEVLSADEGRSVASVVKAIESSQTFYGGSVESSQWDDADDAQRLQAVTNGLTVLAKAGCVAKTKSRGVTVYTRVPGVPVPLRKSMAEAKLQRSTAPRPVALPVEVVEEEPEPISSGKELEWPDVIIEVKACEPCHGRGMVKSGACPDCKGKGILNPHWRKHLLWHKDAPAKA